MTHARRAPSSSAGLPSGPAKSSSASPAFSWVAFVHRERDALAALVDAQHDELARPDLARYLGRAHDHAGDFRIERFYSFDGIHGFALSLLR